MSQFDELIATASAADIQEKKQFLQFFLNVIQKSRGKLTSDDRSAILEFAYAQVDAVSAGIPGAASYKEKNQLFESAELTLGIIMGLCPSPDTIPQEKLMKIQALVKQVEEERKIETTLDDIFAQDSIQESDITRLLYWVKQTVDEYQRSVIYSGLLHYRERVRLMTESAKAKLSEHLHSELQRILSLEERCPEMLDALEMLADVCKLFPGEDTPSLLLELLELRQNRINYYAVESLLALNRDIPQWVVDELAQDLVQANLLYGTLTHYGKQSMFPRALANEEYLAKSDLVHWLTYPTELGQAPDEIEYIGKVKYIFKKDVYHVFKFRSASKTLGDDQKNKWLIGWSSQDGGTFSNFDEFDKFDLGNTEKTLKNIKKKLIG